MPIATVATPVACMVIGWFLWDLGKRWLARDNAEWRKTVVADMQAHVSAEVQKHAHSKATVDAAIKALGAQLQELGSEFNAELQIRKNKQVALLASMPQQGAQPVEAGAGVRPVSPRR